MLVRDFVELNVESDPAKTALVVDGTRLTFADLERLGNRIANGLRDLGVDPGDRVLTLLPNSIDAVLSILGATKASAVFSVINDTTKPAKTAHLLRDSGAGVLITDRRRAARLTAELGTVDVPHLIVVDADDESGGEVPGTLALRELIERGAESRPPRQAGPDDLACLIYTSGSTGVPKGVMCGQDNVVFASGSIITYLENTVDDVVISGLPLSFDYGLYQMLMMWRCGGTLVLQRSFAFPAATLQAIEAERVTGLPGVPTFFSLLLQLDLEPFDLQSLRYLTNTAAALPPSHIMSLRRAFPCTRLYSMYGITECKRALYLPPEELDDRPGSVGIPIPGTEAWLIDQDGLPLGPGSEGELVVRGRHVMRGYWGDQALTDATFRAGPTPQERELRTGDIMRMDEAGRFSFVARRDDLIKSRGEKVWPKEVENALYQLPQVIKAAVVGEPDPVLGQRVKAIIVSRGGLSAGDVILHCRRELEDFMIPTVVEFRDDLAVSPAGKISKIGL
jgi:amino acid adenylation domain-containing protein